MLMLVLLLLLSSDIDSHAAIVFTPSRAAYFHTSDGFGNPNGACGYHGFGSRLNGGRVAAAAQLFGDGAGCGACYQVRCTYAELCDPNGATIVVTDHGEGDGTDFIMSPVAFRALSLSSNPNTSECLFAMGVVDIEYRRVGCGYAKKKRMVVKVEESSSYPDYLAFTFLYAGGKRDILSVDVYDDGSCEWKAMRRSYGAVWDIAPPPKGEVKVRIKLMFAEGEQWLYLPNAIPSAWCPGCSYDSGLQLFE